MNHQLRIIFVLISGLVGCGLLASADIPRGIDFTGDRVDRIEEKRFQKKAWSRPGSPNLLSKKFPLTEWNKHFNSLGSKRAPIAMAEKGEKERYKVETLDFKTKRFDMSRWNDRMAKLHERAAIQMDDKAEIAANRQMYKMLMQDAKQYKELGEELSLRDINRYQFRRNRTSSGVPVNKAGSRGQK